MLFDAVKRILGYGGTGSRQETEKQPIKFDLTQENQNQPSGIFRDDEPAYRPQMPPDISRIESEIASIHKLMEQQMHSMMGSFGFILDNPFSGFGFDDPMNDKLQSTPFQGPHNPVNPIHPVVPELHPPPLNPRDEVLKPEFRSSSAAAQWSGQDLVLDERLREEDLGSVISELRPPNRLPQENGSLVDTFSQFFGGDLFRNGLWNGSSSPDSVFSSSTVTVYSNVNGHKSVEKIVRHPDGKIERTVISDDKRPQP